MPLHAMDRFNKQTYKTAAQMARKRAQSMTEQFNEPAYILEGEEEFIVLRGISWKYRNDPNPTWREGWPKWAKTNPDDSLVEVVYPEDKLGGDYTKGAKLVEKMTETVRKVRFDQVFELDEMYRDYGDVRLMLQLVRSAAEHLDAVIIHLGFAVQQANEEHKKNGHKKGIEE